MAVGWFLLFTVKMMFGLWFSLKVHGLQIGKSVYSIFAEVLQRRADWGMDLPPLRVQRSEMYSQKCDFQYEYKLKSF